MTDQTDVPSSATILRRITAAVPAHYRPDPSTQYCACGTWASDMGTHRADIINAIVRPALEERDADLARYEEVQGEMNETAINLTRDVARTKAALSDMTRDRDRQKWYVAENDRKRKVQRARAERAEGAVARARAARDRIANSVGVDAIYCLDLLDEALGISEATATKATETLTHDTLEQP